MIALLGGGLASVAAVETLRAEGYDGRIRLISDEIEMPYDRPPLSKSYLAAQSGATDINLHDESWYRDQRVEMELGQRVVKLELRDRCVVTERELRIEYDKLLIAVGARARALQDVATNADVRLHYLRNIRDAQQIKALATSGSRVVLIGGGVIGLETAATLAHLGCHVTVLEAAERIMARFFPPLLSRLVTEIHTQHGIEVRTQVRIERIEALADEVNVHLHGGTVCSADFLVVGVGVIPNSEIAAQAGLPIRLQGVEVDAFAQTRAPGVFAAGDVASFPLLGGWARWENWTHARAHAATAARQMLGKTPPGYAETPWVWSDQHEFNIQVTGSTSAERVVMRGSMASGRLTVFHLTHGKVVGATTLNDSRNKSAIRKLIESGTDVAPECLADSAVDLKRLVAGLPGAVPTVPKSTS